MASGMTKTALVRSMAEKLQLTNKQSATFLELLAETAVKETKKNGVFIIPGLGRLVKAERKARMGPQSANRRTDQDQGQDRCEVPRRQGREGCNRTQEGISTAPRKT